MSSIKEALTQSKSIQSLMIEANMNKLFVSSRASSAEGLRIGMHGSGIIVSENEWCLRKQVLSFKYMPEDEDIPIHLSRIFLEGWYVHMKWQKLFEDAGIAIGIEQRGHSKDMQLLFTPDAIIELNKKKYVVEIKSMNKFAFDKATTHPSGRKQLLLYMHMLGIPNGFVLCENKNDQTIKIFEVEYEPMDIKPYIQRMLDVKFLLQKSKLPPKVCKDCTSKLAKVCSYKKACFTPEIATLL